MKDGALAVSHDFGATPSAEERARALAELGELFIREFNAVAGKTLFHGSFEQAAPAIAELAAKAHAREVGVADGVSLPLAQLTSPLEAAGLRVWRPAADHTELNHDEMARWDIGVVEAGYAIASSGTLVIVGSDANPRALSLVPPISVVLLRTDRILPDLATLLPMLEAQAREGTAGFVLVTGPSRTADIEKRLVLGAHGPKELYLALIEAATGAE